MPYILSFVKSVPVSDPERYINDCCIGGDVVLDRLLPVFRERYGNVQANQEDWGWFAWFEQAGIKLAVDVHTNDHSAGEFQVHLTSRTPRLVFGTKIQDTPELEALRELVVSRLRSWSVMNLEVERADEKYKPL